MSHSSGCETDRGQVRPLSALVAVLALTLALTAYAGVMDSLATPTESGPVTPALKHVEAAATTGAIVHPDAIDHRTAGLDGYRVNVTLTTPGHRYASGPPPAETASTASASVAVAVGDEVTPGTLRVEVWEWTAA